MRGSRVPWWGDLTAVAGLALAGLALALIPVPGPVRTAAVLPLLLILPGYALAAALFRPGEISRELRMVLSVALSVGVTALGGLLVQLVVRLDRPVWAALLTGVTLLAIAIALDRRDGMSPDSEETRLRLPRIGVATVVARLLGHEPSQTIREDLLPVKALDGGPAAYSASPLTSRRAAIWTKNFRLSPLDRLPSHC